MSFLTDFFINGATPPRDDFQRALNNVQDCGTSIKMVCVAVGIFSGILISHQFPLGYVGAAVSVVSYFVADILTENATHNIRQIRQTASDNIPGYALGRL